MKIPPSFVPLKHAARVFPGAFPIAVGATTAVAGAADWLLSDCVSDSVSDCALKVVANQPPVAVVGSCQNEILEQTQITHITQHANVLVVIERKSEKTEK